MRSRKDPIIRSKLRGLQSAGVETQICAPDIRDLLQPNCWHRWAVQFSEQGDYLRAAEFLRHAAVLDPQNALLRFDYGVALVKAERLQAARRSFLEALRLRPTWQELNRVLSQIDRRIEQSANTRPGNATSVEHRFLDEPFFSPEATLRQDISACGDLLAAIERLWPRHQANEKIREFASAHLHNAPILIATARRLAGVMIASQRRARDWMTVEDGFWAKQFALRAMRQRPQYESFMTAALVLQILGEHEHAAAILRWCLHDVPDDPDALMALGETMIELGDLENGIHHLRSGLHSRPHLGTPRFALTKAGPSSDPESEIRSLRARIGDEAVAKSEGTAMLYAIARRYEQLGRHDDAFAVYQEASQRKKEALLDAVPSPEDALARVYATIARYSRDFFAARSRWGDPSSRPVFIVGMPRSGTTLTEQILASHEQVYGAGELQDISIIGRRIASRLPEEVLQRKRGPYPPGLELVSKPEARDISRRHLAALRLLDRDAAYVVDKAPTNFQLLGMIAVLFPNAKIIHCTRDPIDTCVSCFRNNFSWPFFELEGLARYTRAYQLLMQHWKAVLSLNMFEMRYEETVADLEGQTRKLLDFAGLPWSDKCLTFYDTLRGVRTPSRMQVRQPIYQTSVGSWRKFEAHLEPLLKHFCEEPSLQQQA